MLEPYSRNKHNNSKNRKQKTGKWNNGEKYKFNIAYVRFGKDWPNISVFIKTRTETQCRTYYKKYVKKMEKNPLLALAYFAEVVLLSNPNPVYKKGDPVRFRLRGNDSPFKYAGKIVETDCRRSDYVVEEYLTKKRYPLHASNISKLL